MSAEVYDSCYFPQILIPTGSCQKISIFFEVHLFLLPVLIACATTGGGQEDYKT